MTSTVNLTSSVRSSLLSLQDTASLQATTNQHLSTGKKVSSALDNPVNFFTAQGLDSRSTALSGLLDGMSNGIQTIQAANQGLTSITSLLTQLQSVVKTARQDTSSAIAGTAKDLGTNTATSGSLTLGVGNGLSVAVALTTANASITAGGTAVGGTVGNAIGAGKGGTIQIASSSLAGGAVNVTLSDTDKGADIATKINAALATDSNGINVHASYDATTGKVSLTDFNNNAVSITDASGNTNGTTAAAFGTPATTASQTAALTTDLLVKSINNNSNLTGKVTASKSSTGSLQIQSTTGNSISVAGSNGTALDGDATKTTSANAGTPYLDQTRQNAANQFNSILQQINSTAKDSGYNGTNLLNGDSLKLVFNEKTGTNASTMNVQAQNADGTSYGALTAAKLGLNTASTTADGSTTDFTSNANLDAFTDAITSALSTIQVQSSQFGTALAVTQSRQDFTKNMINVLQTGSSNLTDADMNAEAANSQSLSTRNSLAISALSLANTQNQSVLQLLR